MFFSTLNGLLFNIVPLIVITGFIFVLGTLIIRSIQGAKQWNKNNNSPVLTVNATVVTKRSDVHYHNHHTGDTVHHSSSTSYYVTFEVESRDRIEFRVKDVEYGMLVEKDQGELTFQGTRYLSFKRNKV